MDSGGVSIPMYSVAAVEDGDQLGDLPFDLDDLPPEIRIKIDEIVRNNEDFEAQIDAIDALLFGSRRPSDPDIESGVDCYDSDSASNGTNPASVASSSEYATVGAALSPRPTTSTNHSTAGLNSCLDPADYLTQLIVPPPPPPELFDSFSPSATSFECVPPPPPPSDFYQTLPPPVFEVTEHDDVLRSVPLSPFSVSTSTQLPFTPPPDYDNDGPALSFLPPPPDFVAGSAPEDKLPSVKPNVAARLSQSAAPNAPPTPLVSVSTHFRSTAPPPVAPKPSLARAGSVASPVTSSVDFRNGAATPSLNSTTFDPTPTAAAVQQQKLVTPLPKNVPAAAIAEFSSNIVVEPPKIQPLQPSSSSSSVVNDQKAVVSAAPSIPQPQPSLSSSSSSIANNQKTAVGVASPIPAQPVVVINGIVAPVAGGRSPSTSRRRFTGTTEDESQQQLNVTTRQKTSTNFLQKLLRTWKRSSANADLGAEKSQSELSASSLPKNADWCGGGTLPSKSKKRPVSGPIKFSGVDTSGAMATLPRNSKMPSRASMLQVIAEKPTNASEVTLRESSSAASLRNLPRSISFEPTSNEKSGPKNKKSAARLLQTQSCFVDLPEAEVELNDDDRDSSLGSSGEDEYDSVNATLRRMNKRKHLRDETGRLTIASYGNHAMSKATSMMTLNITKWEDPGPRSSIVHSRTTDDLKSHPDDATSKRFDNVPVGGTLQYKKKNPLQQLTATAFSNSGSTTSSSLFTGNRSPRLSRPASSAQLQGSVQNYCDELDEIQRSSYLSAPSSWSTAANGAAAVTSSSGQSLAEITSWLLRRSLMTSLVDEDSPLMDSISLVSSVLNSPMNSEIADMSSSDAPYTTGSNGGKLSTFQSPLTPMRWSDDSKTKFPVPADDDFSFDRLFLQYFTSDGASPKRPKWGVTAQPAASGAKSSSTPAEVVPATATSSIGQPKQPPPGRPAKPVPAQRPKSLHTEGVARNQNKLSPSVAEAKNNMSTSSGGPGSGLIPRQTSLTDFRPSPLTPVGRTVLATSRGHTPPPDYDDVDDLQLQTVPAAAAVDHWGVHSQQELTPNLLPPAEFSSDECVLESPLDPSAAQDIVELVLFKSYSTGRRPIQEAIDDLRAIVVDIEWTKSSVSTSGYVAGISAGGSDARDALSVAVRQFVTESKNFVAFVVDTSSRTAINGAVNTEFCSKISSSMRALASMTIGCRRLGGGPLSFPVKAVVEVVDNVAEVVRLFGETLDAAQLIESRSEAGRRFAIDDINAHVVSLASILGQLVQRLRAMV